eukprot:207901-Chlamydomonas_euryale.AAC.3
MAILAVVVVLGCGGCGGSQTVLQPAGSRWCHGLACVIMQATGANIVLHWCMQECRRAGMHTCVEVCVSACMHACMHA